MARWTTRNAVFGIASLRSGLPYRRESAVTAFTIQNPDRDVKDYFAHPPGMTRQRAKVADHAGFLLVAAGKGAGTVARSESGRLASRTFITGPRGRDCLQGVRQPRLAGYEGVTLMRRRVTKEVRRFVEGLTNVERGRLLLRMRSARPVGARARALPLSRA